MQSWDSIWQGYDQIQVAEAVLVLIPSVSGTDNYGTEFKKEKPTPPQLSVQYSRDKANYSHYRRCSLKVMKFYGN
jgi:hypothetical protein